MERRTAGAEDGRSESIAAISPTIITNNLPFVASLLTALLTSQQEGTRTPHREPAVQELLQAQHPPPLQEYLPPRRGQGPLNCPPTGGNGGDPNLPILHWEGGHVRG